MSSQWSRVFQELSKEYWAFLFRFLVSLGHNQNEADDLMQITLLKALQAFPKFAQGNIQSIELCLKDSLISCDSVVPQSERLHLRNWMLRIAKNSFLDLKSSQKRWRSEEYIDSADNVPMLHPGSEDEFYTQALDDDWKEKLQVLNPKQRSILFLIAENYSYKEVAEILEIPIGTVMSNLSRAIQKLK